MLFFCGEKKAGGHRGIFLAKDILDFSQQKSTSQLLLHAHSILKVRKPLVVAGNIKNDKDVKEALSKGATFVQIGTPFLLSEDGEIGQQNLFIFCQ